MKWFVSFVLVALLMAGCGELDEPPPPHSPNTYLDDKETRNRIIAEAIDGDTLQKRGEKGKELKYAPNEQTPYTGWAKYMSLFDNGQVWYIVQYKDGKMDGLMNRWHENGQKSAEVNFKDGKMDGLWIRYGEDGTEGYSGLYKDGEEVD
jgi:antitoxin component YwqK of YwqJK toxin-antitoxin module